MALLTCVTGRISLLNDVYLIGVYCLLSFISIVIIDPHCESSRLQILSMWWDIDVPCHRNLDDGLPRSLLEVQPHLYNSHIPTLISLEIRTLYLGYI